MGLKEKGYEDVETGLIGHTAVCHDTRECGTKPSGSIQGVEFQQELCEY